MKTWSHPVANGFPHLISAELVCDNILIDKDGLIMVADLDVIPPKQVHRAWLAPEFLAKGDLTMPVTTQVECK